ncbi:leukocyte elastase inhibitor-like isoform X2 [Leptidea sinapis]|uniref:leukocyte elastase inhibitor-like isoform X2 n=1 Tax=Leptidea sinapis TaxID=189913 RepID=UPI0021320AD8|nr:leukocyte elastase inhibitor-like isoform X2 [Leptidea sinapis]
MFRTSATLTFCFFYIVCVSTNLRSIALDDDLRIKNVLKESTPDLLALSVNEFGFKLSKLMMKNGNNSDNIVISPTGISGLLAMTLLGSVGASYQQLAKVLGFSEDLKINRENHEQFGDLLRTLSSQELSSTTLYADAIFTDSSSSLRPAYRSYLRRVYDGEALSVDFKQNVEVQMLINEWVSNHTNEKIPKFLQQPLPTDTKVVLLSALYFAAQWKHPFMPEFTKMLPFHTPNGTVMVDQMLNMGSFSYINSHDDGLHMIAFPYNDSMNTMYAIQPRRPHKTKLSQLLEKLNYTHINNLIEMMSERKCIVRYPKMSIQSNEKLEDYLQMLGVKTIFSPEEANFALMIDSNPYLNKTEEELISRFNTGEGGKIEEREEKSLKEIVDRLPNPGIYINTVLHDVRININEYGTEAVAVTSGILARTAEQFYADSPFYMFIRNEKTKLVTFSAIIFDPTS